MYIITAGSGQLPRAEVLSSGYPAEDHGHGAWDRPKFEPIFSAAPVDYLVSK